MILRSDEETIIAWAENRLLDPQTNEIYHKVFNPPIETDKKLMERLKPIEVDISKLSKEVSSQNTNSENLIKRVKFEFGIEDEFGKIPLLNEISV